MIVKTPWVDWHQMNERMNQDRVSSDQKLKSMYQHMGGTVIEGCLLPGAVMGVCAIGGLPVRLNDEGALLINDRVCTLDQLKKEWYTTLGMSAFMSYLNPGQKPLENLAETTLNLHHDSILHTINLSVLIVGLSAGVEHELASQRDLVHLSRLTVSKTKAQQDPCLVLNNPDHQAVYLQVLKQTQEALKENPIEDKELRNLLFPAAKASAIMVTGSLKNMMKIIALKDSEGKEDEFVRLLHQWDRLLESLFPDIWHREAQE